MSPAMREEYRDELAAAHRRIDGLENELADERAVNASLKHEMKALREATPSRGRGAGSYFGLGIVTTLGGLMVFGAVVAIIGRWSSREHEVVSSPLPVAVPAVEHAQVSYYPQAGAGPRVADVNGDDTEDFVWLFWDSRHEQTPIHVVAVDGKNFSVLWSSPGFPSQWYSERTHILVKDNFVVVSDSKDGVRILDLATGELRASFQFQGGAFRMCAAAGLPNVVLVGREGETENHAYDLSTGQPAGVEKTPDCAYEPPSCTKSPGSSVCAGHRFDLHPKTKDVSGYGTLEASDAFVVRASRSTSDKGAPRQGWALGGVRKSGELKWERRVAEDADVEHFGPDQWAMDPTGSSFAVGYQLLSGEMKVVARNTEDGALLWSRVVPDTTEGSRLQSLVATNDRVYVVTNQRLHVFARKGGEPIRDLEWLTIPVEGAPRSRGAAKKP